MSGDPEQEYFSDGMAEDLITDISKISGVSVTARNSSFAFKGQSVDVKEIASCVSRHQGSHLVEIAFSLPGVDGAEADEKLVRVAAVVHNRAVRGVAQQLGVNDTSSEMPVHAQRLDPH